MMLPRVLEPEVMDAPDEAVDYNAMDHAEVNRIFAEDLLAADWNPAAGEILDVGTGTALIPLEICRQAPTAKVRAVDLSRHMLEVARQNVEKAGLTERICLERIDAKELPYPDGRFAAVVSNSIVHHIPEPKAVLAEMWRVLAPGGLIFARDLLRPAKDAEVRRLVETYAAGANRHQRQLFEDSLRASLRVEELQAILAELGCDPQSARATSDRHWTWTQRK
ncbi:MAG: class I SAM-dependent methyltransferase [Pirellulales bacterium]|nr:class I SAM-dependent methyltransferase [Pirellulales bacterium]